MIINGIEFDDELVMNNLMGPNSIRIVDEITRGMDFRKGMRILDLGCGKGLTSIFLAKKFGATVYATDLWISATENFNRFKELDLQDLIIPIHADAHDLPYAEGFFDVIISVDSYHYFGHEEGYLDKHLAPLLKKGGRILVGVPGLRNEFSNGVPEEMKPYYKLEYNFHSCNWWMSLWELSEFVDNISCSEMDCHEQTWKEWLSCDHEYARRDIAMMEADGGKYYNTVFISAKRI